MNGALRWRDSTEGRRVTLRETSRGRRTSALTAGGAPADGLTVRASMKITRAVVSVRILSAALVAGRAAGPTGRRGALWSRVAMFALSPLKDAAIPHPDTAVGRLAPDARRHAVLYRTRSDTRTAIAEVVHVRTRSWVGVTEALPTTAGARLYARRQVAAM